MIKQEENTSDKVYNETMTNIGQIEFWQRITPA